MTVATLRTDSRSGMFALRIADSEKAEIKARADAAGMSIGDYMIRAALGELDIDAPSIEQRFAQVEGRVDRLEQLAELGGYG